MAGELRIGKSKSEYPGCVVGSSDCLDGMCSGQWYFNNISDAARDTTSHRSGYLEFWGIELGHRGRSDDVTCRSGVVQTDP